MTFDFNVVWVTAVLLCSLRLSALLMMMPVLQAIGMPTRIRVLFIVMLSVTLVSGMRLVPGSIPTDIGSLITAGATEVLVGALMAFGIFTAFAAFSFAGNALDLQIGFNIANIFDPTTKRQSPLISSLIGMVAVALFFTLNAHHTLLRGVAYSLERIPLGGEMHVPEPTMLIAQFGSIFSLGLLLASPVLFLLFLIEITLAVLSRNLPQLNVFMLSIPIKIGVGLSVLAYLSGHFGSVASKIFDSTFNFWDRVL